MYVNYVKFLYNSSYTNSCSSSSCLSCVDRKLQKFCFVKNHSNLNDKLKEFFKFIALKNQSSFFVLSYAHHYNLLSKYDIESIVNIFVDVLNHIHLKEKSVFIRCNAKNLNDLINFLEPIKKNFFVTKFVFFLEDLNLYYKLIENVLKTDHLISILCLVGKNVDYKQILEILKRFRNLVLQENFRLKFFFYEPFDTKTFTFTLSRNEQKKLSLFFREVSNFIPKNNLNILLDDQNKIFLRKSWRFVVTPDGNVLSLFDFKTIFGNIFFDNFEDIYDNSIYFGRKVFSFLSLMFKNKKFKECFSCPIFEKNIYIINTNRMFPCIAKPRSFFCNFIKNYYLWWRI